MIQCLKRLRIVRQRRTFERRWKNVPRCFCSTFQVHFLRKSPSFLFQILLVTPPVHYEGKLKSPPFRACLQQAGVRGWNLLLFHALFVTFRFSTIEYPPLHSGWFNVLKDFESFDEGEHSNVDEKCSTFFLFHVSGSFSSLIANRKSQIADISSTSFCSVSYSLPDTQFINYSIPLFFRFATIEYPPLHSGWFNVLKDFESFDEGEHSNVDEKMFHVVFVPRFRFFFFANRHHFCSKFF